MPLLVRRASLDETIVRNDGPLRQFSYGVLNDTEARWRFPQLV